jgi:hypothetical protein
VLALAAAGSVLEIGGVIHRLSGFVFPLLGKLLPLLLSFTLWFAG